MKLQVAIDRVTLREAIILAEQLDGKVDILELGTSLVKDYGNRAIEQLREILTQTELLVDSKTIDEGDYEFNQAFRYGGDIVTVMGAASIGTLDACYRVAQKYNKTMMIDLLEVSDEKIYQIKNFSGAIYSLHHSVDRKDYFDATKSVLEFHKKFPGIKRIAIAGGIDLKQAQMLSEQGIVEVIIVGSKITKAEEPLLVANEFIGVVHK